ncbi:MAG: hypothetical protein C6P37_14915 [Caldibacillus debilis]|uniref:Uncharacterized protein n=1 Tax=Caldibacillus debilis TaxID=301148 RepID=A0A3E0JZ18_9BACI|nr:hypothetical protein [Caldibacillus debilis]REJ25519.1 MAG: hypothetical protein C6P37_14915 [Caldibacillus debilis]
MKKILEQELRYGINSKIYFILVMFLCGLFGVVLFLNYSSVTELYQEYEGLINYYEKNNLNIEEELNNEYIVETSENGGTIINPIVYYNDALSKYIYAASSEYRLSQLLESSILYFPIVFGLLGLVISTNDYKYRTIKLRTVRINKNRLGLAKQISIAISSFIIIVVSLLFAYIVGEIMYQYLAGKIPIKDFPIETDTFGDRSSIFLKFFFAYIIALFFAEIGYTFGILFKNMYVGIIIIFVYTFIIPNLGVYDLKNTIFYFANQIFDFYGVISADVSENTGFISSFFIILLTFILSFVVNNIVFKKRSSFES